MGANTARVSTGRCTTLRKTLEPGLGPLWDAGVVPSVALPGVVAAGDARRGGVAPAGGLAAAGRVA